MNHRPINIPALIRSLIGMRADSGQGTRKAFTYRKEVDGLRALAVLPVILFHAKLEIFSGGFVGVDVFFVISGYLITSILLQDLRSDTFSLLSFYERRARRILPALLVVMLACLPFAWWLMLPSQMKNFAQSIVSTLFFSSNILFWLESGYFASDADEKPLLHTWSLAVEEQFYIIFPLLLLFLWVSLAFSEWGWRHDTNANFYLTPFRVWELLAGALVALWLHDFDVPENHTLSLTGLVAILLAIVAFDDSTPFPSVYALIPVVGTVLVLLYTSPNVWVGRLLTKTPIVGVGLMSYSAYLWHQPLFAFARVQSTNEPSATDMLGLSLLSLILAYITWRWIEQPFRSRFKVTAATFWCSVAAVAGLLLMFGVAGQLSHGNFGRFSADLLAVENNRYRFNEYVWFKKNLYRNRDFQENHLKVLVAGDSNSGDLVNALQYAFPHHKVSFTTLEIQAGCGNLYLPAADRDNLNSTCNADWLHLPRSGQLMQEADLVFLANNWSALESGLLQDSMLRLRRDFGDKFWVFGTKSTQVDAYFYEAIQMGLKSGGDFRALPDSKGFELNKRLKQTIPKFIDPYEWMCAPDGCLLAVNNANWYVYDGFHLTEAGARDLGLWLSKQIEF